MNISLFDTFTQLFPELNAEQIAEKVRATDVILLKTLHVTTYPQVTFK